MYSDALIKQNNLVDEKDGTKFLAKLQKIEDSLKYHHQVKLRKVLGSAEHSPSTSFYKSFISSPRSPRSPQQSFYQRTETFDYQSKRDSRALNHLLKHLNSTIKSSTRFNSPQRTETHINSIQNSSDEDPPHSPASDKKKNEPSKKSPSPDFFLKHQLTPYSQEFINSYYESIQVIDLISAREGKNLEKLVNQALDEGNKLSEITNETKVIKANFTTPDEISISLRGRKAFILKIDIKNKVFPMSVSISTRLTDNEIETFVSRWNTKPNPTNYEQRFFVKDFKVIFQEDKEMNELYMTFLLRRSYKLKVKITFAGLQKPNSLLNEHYLNPVNKKNRQNISNNFEVDVRKYLNFYEKKFMTEQHYEKLKMLEAKRSDLQKVKNNIIMSPKYRINKQQNLQQLVLREKNFQEKAKKIKHLNDEQTYNKIVVNTCKKEINQEIKTVLEGQHSVYHKKKLFEAQWYLMMTLGRFLSKLSLLKMGKKHLFSFKNKKLNAAKIIETHLLKKYNRIKDEWPGNTLNHQRISKSMTIASYITFSILTLKSKKIVISFLKQSSVQMDMYQKYIDFHKALKQIIYRFRKTMRTSKILYDRFYKLWQKSTFQVIEENSKKKNSKIFDAIHQMSETSFHIGIIRALVIQIINDYVIIRYKNLEILNRIQNQKMVDELSMLKRTINGDNLLLNTISQAADMTLMPANNKGLSLIEKLSDPPWKMDMNILDFEIKPEYIKNLLNCSITICSSKLLTQFLKV